MSADLLFKKRKNNKLKKFFMEIFKLIRKNFKNYKITKKNLLFKYNSLEKFSNYLKNHLDIIFFVRF